MNNRTTEKLQGLRERAQHLRTQHDSAALAYAGDKLEADANALLHDAAAGLTPDAVTFVQAIISIAQGGDDVLPELPADVGPAQLAEPPRHAPMPDRIIGLLCAEERAELAEVAKSIPEAGRDRLAAQLGLELASEGRLVLLTEPERAAARLHADRQHERAHVARLTDEARASGDRLDEIAKAATAGPGAPVLRNF